MLVICNAFKRVFWGAQTFLRHFKSLKISGPEFFFISVLQMKGCKRCFRKTLIIHLLNTERLLKITVLAKTWWRLSDWNLGILNWFQTCSSQYRNIHPGLTPNNFISVPPKNFGSKRFSSHFAVSVWPL